MDIIKKTDLEASPGGFTQKEAQEIIHLINKHSSNDFSPEEVQKIVESLEALDTKDAISNISKEQIHLILDFFNKGLIYLTVKIAYLILEIAAQKNLPDKEFKEITLKIDMGKIIESDREQDIEKQRMAYRRSHRKLFAINSSLLPGFNGKYHNGWIRVGKFLIKMFYFLAINLSEIFMETKNSLLDEKNISEVQSLHIIDNLENNEFLKQNDPDGEVKKFVKQVVKAINNYNSEHKDSIFCFDDNKYTLMVIHRYPKETKENTTVHQIIIEKDQYDRLKVANS